MTNVLKASGKIEPYNENKVKISMEKVGIPEDLQKEILLNIQSKLYENIPTSKIYDNIITFLQNSKYPLGQTKYRLRQAIMDLGPTGYPFEDYVSEILKLEGYQTQVRQNILGKCISHEIDIVAQKDNMKYMIECKFHNSPGSRSQVHVPLYTKARFDDIKETNNMHQAWLITNTKITSDALNYALCSNMKVMSWDYPQNGSFKDLVEKYRLYPVTASVNLSQNQKQILTTNHIVLAKDICQNPSSLDVLGLPEDKKNSVIMECKLASSS